MVSPLRVDLAGTSVPAFFMEKELDGFGADENAAPGNLYFRHK